VLEHHSSIYRFDVELDLQLGRDEPFPDLQRIHAYVRAIQQSVAKFHGPKVGSARNAANNRSDEEEGEGESENDTQSGSLVDAVVLWVLDDIVNETKRVHAPSSVMDTCRAEGDDNNDASVTVEKGVPIDATARTRRLGLHVIFPFLATDTERACYYRATLVSDLRFRFGERPPETSEWEKCVADHHRGASPRLPFSSTFSRCKTCAHPMQPRQPYKECHRMHSAPGSHMLYHGRAYWPAMWIDGSGGLNINQTQRLHRESGFCVAWSSLHPAPDAQLPHWHLYPGAPRYDQTKIPQKLQLGNKVSIDDPRCRAIVEAIRKRSGRKVYNEIQALALYEDVRVSARGDSRHYRLFVRGGGSSYCQNKVGDHDSSAIVYFAVDANGASQRCTSREQHAFGLCCKFDFSRILLNSQEKSLLFPDSRQQQPAPPAEHGSNKKHPRSNGIPAIRGLPPSKRPRAVAANINNTSPAAGGRGREQPLQQVEPTRRASAPRNRTGLHNNNTSAHGQHHPAGGGSEYTVNDLLTRNEYDALIICARLSDAQIYERLKREHPDKNICKWF